MATSLSINRPATLSEVVDGQFHQVELSEETVDRMTAFCKKRGIRKDTFLRRAKQLMPKEEELTEATILNCLNQYEAN